MNYEELLELQERIGFVSVGLNDEEIAAIPVITIPRSQENCAICQSELGKQVKKLPVCEHYYHGECIDQWLKHKRTCPVCMAEVPRSS
jgi:E3 ubiquitin-protein ligase Arkadia